jgi:hypothetical protein
VNSKQALKRIAAWGNAPPPAPEVPTAAFTEQVMDRKKCQQLATLLQSAPRRAVNVPQNVLPPL